MKHKLYTAWISVDDELPYEDGEYLCAVSVRHAAGGEGPQYRYVRTVVYRHDGKTWYFERAYKRHSTVTHWMPLPSLPGTHEQA